MSSKSSLISSTKFGSRSAETLSLFLSYLSLLSRMFPALKLFFSSFLASSRPLPLSHTSRVHPGITAKLSISSFSLGPLQLLNGFKLDAVPQSFPSSSLFTMWKVLLDLQQFSSNITAQAPTTLALFLTELYHLSQPWMRQRAFRDGTSPTNKMRECMVDGRKIC